MNNKKICLFCGNNLVKVVPLDIDAKNVKCGTCGEYKITGQALDLPDVIPAERKYILSAVIREASDEGRIITITSDNTQEIINSALIPNGPLESIDRILQYVFKSSETAASYVPLSDNDYPIAYAKDWNVFRYFLEKAIELKYLEEGKSDAMGFSTEYRLTLKGWERVDELRRKVIDSRQAFVAMWFDEDLDEAWKAGIEPALKETGYSPLRLDKVEHNEKIDDKIIADIRKSGLLIADFTGHRGGVYFEAGFAMGLGIPVVWTCREDHLEKAHFDTRQYNHIVWKDPADLKKKLKNRIEASSGIKR